MIAAITTTAFLVACWIVYREHKANERFEEQRYQSEVREMRAKYARERREARKERARDIQESKELKRIEAMLVERGDVSE